MARCVRLKMWENQKIKNSDLQHCRPCSSFGSISTCSEDFSDMRQYVPNKNKCCSSPCSFLVKKKNSKKNGDGNLYWAPVVIDTVVTCLTCCHRHERKKRLGKGFLHMDAQVFLFFLYIFYILTGRDANRKTVFLVPPFLNSRCLLLRFCPLPSSSSAFAISLYLDTVGPKKLFVKIG